MCVYICTHINIYITLANPANTVHCCRGKAKWQRFVTFRCRGQTNGKVIVLWGKQKVMAICCRRQANGKAFCSIIWGKQKVMALCCRRHTNGAAFWYMGHTKGHGNLLQEASKWESVSFYYMGQTKGHGTLLQEAHQWAFVLWGKQKVMAICCRRQTNGAAFCCTKQKQKRYGSLLQGTHKGPYGLRINRDGLNRTYAVYTRYFWQRNHETYGHIRCIYTVLANPTHEIGTACCSSPALCLTMKEYSSPLSLFSINYYDRISNERSTTTQKCSDRG